MQKQKGCECCPLRTQPLASRCGRQNVAAVRIWIVVAVSALIISGTSGAADWNVIPIAGRPYVSFANVSEFYDLPNYTRVSSSVSVRDRRRSIRAEAGKSEFAINNVRFFSEYPIVSNGNDDLISTVDIGKIIEPIMRPDKIAGATPVKRVVIDPGHGGTDNGTAGRWGSEKAFTLDVGLQLRDQLLRDGYQVELTRSGDTAVSLEDRVAFANKFPDAVLVSIHFNSSTGGAGIETYSLAPEGVPSNASPEHHPDAEDAPWHPGNAQDSRNVALAAAVHAMAMTRCGAFDRGVKHSRFHVLREARIPAILVEGGFLSDAIEGQKIATAQYRQQLAAAIADGIKTYNAVVNLRSNGATFASARRSLPAHERSITEPLRDDTPPAPTKINEPSLSIRAGP